MGNVIEFKKHTQQTNDSSSEIYSNNKLLKPVYDFECPVPLYSDEEGQLYTAFYYSATGKTVAIPYFDNIEKIVKYEKKEHSKINTATSELR